MYTKKAPLEHLTFLQKYPAVWYKLMYQWSEYRQSIGKPINAQFLAKNTFHFLLELSSECPTKAQAIINNSISAGYNSLYKLKEYPEPSFFEIGTIVYFCFKEADQPYEIKSGKIVEIRLDKETKAITYLVQYNMFSSDKHGDLTKYKALILIERKDIHTKVSTLTKIILDKI